MIYFDFMEPHDRLKQARIDKGFEHAKDVADAYGWNVNTYSSHENGNRGLSAKAASKYSQRFGVSVDWLLNGKKQTNIKTEQVVTPHDNRPHIPLVSWVSAGQLRNDGAVDDADELPTVYAPDLDPNGDWIALRVDGRSMDKVSPHDSIIFVNRKDTDLIDRGLYVFITNEGEATYKRFIYPDKLEAMTTKPEQFKDIAYDRNNPPMVIGRVRKTILEL